MVILVFAWCIALEGGKILWHASEHHRRWNRLAHVLAAAGLAGVLWPPLVLVAALSVYASSMTLNDKQRGGRLGSALSALSSWPWEVAGWIAVGWPLCLLAIPTAWLAGLWWVSGLRPAHWGPSFWYRLYPRCLVVALGGI